MTEHSLWRVSRALHGALKDRQFDQLRDTLDDDIDWAIYGPIEMFSFFGSRRGKEAVMEVFRNIADNFQIHRLDCESIMLGTDAASSMIKYTLTAHDSGKPITVRLAHFSQFKSGRLSSLRAIVDTFDLVEQALGRPIDLPAIA